MKLDNVSLRLLLFLSFGFTMVPLVVAVAYAINEMHQNAELSEKAIYQVVQQTKQTRVALQKVGDIERKAKLYVLLSEPALRQPYERESYENVRTQLKTALQELQATEGDAQMVFLVNQLAEKERLIYEQIMQTEVSQPGNLPVEDVFRGLHDAAGALWQEVTSRVDRKVGELHERTRAQQQGLLVKGGLLVLISFLLVVALLFVLTGSIRQMDDSIRRLGVGDFQRPVEVTGPRDLRFLGERMEWLRSRLLAVEESKQQFARNVAQQFRKPVDDIWQTSEALEAKAAQNPELQAVAAPLTESVEKLAALLEELLHYNQIAETASEKRAQETVNMRDLLESVIADHRHRLEAKALAVKELVQPVRFNGVPEHLRMIVDNLISNAVKFSPVGGEIRVMVRAAGDTLELEVEDNGPGIDPAEGQRVFEPFFRGRAALANGSEGAGLGLAIVTECVAGLHGKVELIEPRQDETGARIRVELPMQGQAG